MSKILKIIITLNAILIVIGIVFAVTYYIYTSKLTDESGKFSTTIQGDIQSQDESASGVNIEGDHRMRASFKSIQDGEMEVVLLTGETENYSMSSKLFYLCLDNGNQQIYGALKEDSNNIDGSIEIIEAENIAERISIDENLELFLYTHTQNSPTIVKGIVSFDCK